MMIAGADLEICRERKIGLNEDSRTANDGQLIADAHSDPAAFAKLYRRHLWQWKQIASPTRNGIGDRFTVKRPPSGNWPGGVFCTKNQP